MEKYLQGGKIVTTHGVRGEVKVQPWTDTPDVFCALKKVYRTKGGEELPVTSARPQKDMVILKLRGIDTVEEAQKLVNRILYVDREDILPEEGAYFIADLIGLRVLDADSGEEYGTLSEVTSTGANDVFHVKKADGKISLVPNLKDVVVKTDLENGVMLIRPLMGLMDYEN